VQEWLCERAFRPAAHLVVLALAPLRVPPSAVVLASGTAGLAGAVELARGHLVVAAVLVQLKTVLDNADGQLARLTNRVSLLGRYLDSEVDLLVNAALLAAIGWYAAAPLAALAGFVALTAVLSLNFNLERLYRAAPESAPDVRGVTAVLQRAYALAYGWQDALVERFIERRLREVSDEARAAYHDRMTVTVFANLGMSTQLATFGLCVAFGHPLAFIWLVIAELAVAVMLILRRETLVREVALAGQPGGIA